MNAPRIDRPAIPADYGITKATEFVEWSRVEERLAADRLYWVVTVGRSGRPRVRPIDGLYVDGTIYVGGSPQTRWVREMGENPHVAIHLDGTEEVIIVEGDAEVLAGIGEELAKALAAASNAKFPEYRMTANFYRANGAIAIRPRKAIAWTDITKDPTRFRFDDVIASRASPRAQESRVVIASPIEIVPSLRMSALIPARCTSSRMMPGRVFPSRVRHGSQSSTP